MTADLIIRLLTIFNLLLGGGLVGIVLRHRFLMTQLRVNSSGEVRDGDRKDFQLVIAEMRSQRDEAIAHSSRLEERIDHMEVEIQGLRLARDLDPFPCWVVDRQSRYLFVNREFERHFLEPDGRTYRDIIDQSHEEAGWPQEFCDTLKALDAAASSRPDGTARAVSQLTIPVLGVCQVTVHKFPIRFKPAGIIVGFAGYITDITPDQTLVGRQK